MAVNIATDSDAAVLDGQVEPVEFDPNLTEADIQAAVDEAFGNAGPQEANTTTDSESTETPAVETPEVEPTGSTGSTGSSVSEVSELEKLRGELQFRTTFESELSSVSTAVEKAAAEVMRCESIVEEAKGDLKSAREKYDQVVIELRGLTRDFANGQWRLPFEGPTTNTAEAAGPAPTETNRDVGSGLPEMPKIIDPAVSSPISELSKKKLKEIIGAEEFDRANNSDEVVGLTNKQVETLEGDNVVTIADLEKKLRERPLFLEDLSGFGPAAQNRLQWSLFAWRKKNPQPVVEGE